MPALNAAPPTPRSSAPLLLLVALFLLPLLIGNGLFWLGWRPQRLAHHGELLQPPPTLALADLRHADGSLLANAELHGKWLLLLAVDGTCDADCRRRLQQLRQVHVALNHNQARVAPVLIVSSAGEPGRTTGLLELQREFPGLVVATQATGNALAEPPVDRRGLPVYVVDPLAKVVLRYAGASDMRGVLKDLERLLKYSWLR